MPNMELQSELLSLQSQISIAESMTAAARTHSGDSLPPHGGPVVGLVMMVEAVEAQNKVLKKIHKILEKMA